MIVRAGAALCGAILLSVCSSAAMAGKVPETKAIEKQKVGRKKKSAAKVDEKGIASIYAYDGEKTANGETASPHGLTAAHKSLPFGTKVLVTNESNRRSVVVRINDRGPFVKGRIIDLTPAGAKALGFEQQGIAKVTLAAAPKLPVPLPRRRYASLARS